MVDRKELGESEHAVDLVPGKPEALYRYAQTLRDRATDVIADAEALKQIDTGAWTGPAYEAYAEKHANEWPKWLKLGDAMAYGAQAIESYANCLGWAQMQANQAIELYRRGQQLTSDAKQAHTEAVTDYNSGRGDPTALPPVFHDPGEEYRQAARELLDRARGQLDAVANESATTSSPCCARRSRSVASARPSEFQREQAHRLVAAVGVLLADLAEADRVVEAQ